jgi:hypothetical protein
MYLLKLKPIFCLFFLIVLIHFTNKAQTYPTPGELNKQFESLAKSNPGNIKIHQLAVSPGQNQLIVVEIGQEITKTDKKNQAIFVLANPEGINPLASYASLNLAKLILKNEKNLKFTWYILPSLNPDAMKTYFAKQKWENSRNLKKFNDDQDDATDEDGPDDLNGDGFITQMRVKNPQGTWIIDGTDKRLMRKADPNKAEKGIYTLYQEGIDNDNDGEYNEDPIGGINTGITFPHLFKTFSPTTGFWPGSTPEVYNLMKFIFAHPEIAATFVFGSSNFCLVPPEGGRKASADFDKIKIPDEQLEMLGAEKGKTYTMDEIIEMAQPLVPPGLELTPSMIASFLNLGAVVNPLKEDLAWYTELSDLYKDFLKTAKFDIESLDPDKAKDGSFELWSYYQLGLPSFSLNFFTLPKPKEEKKEGTGISLEKLEGMNSDEFIALGVEKIQAFLKENNAPEQYKAQTVIDMLKSGQTTLKQMAGMLKNMPKPKKSAEADPALKALLVFSDKNLGGKGYVDWQTYKHPTLGDVEIGGAVPFVSNIPPFAWADSLINIQLPWIFTIADKLPQLKIADYKVKSLGDDIYQLEIWIENTKYLPYPTEMGKRNENPAPCILILEAESLEFLSGHKRTPIKSVPGLKAVKQTFMLKVNRGKTIKATLESKSVGNDSKEVKL